MAYGQGLGSGTSGLTSWSERGGVGVLVSPAGGGTRRGSEGGEVAMSVEMAAALLPFLEEAGEGTGVRLVGAKLDRVDTGGADGARPICLGLGLAHGEAGAAAFVAGINFHQFAGFGVFEDESSEGGEFEFIAIGDLDGHEVMAAGDLTEAAADGLSEEIREQDHDGAAREDSEEEVEGLGEVGASLGGLVEEDFADDAEDVAAAFIGCDKLLDL